MKPVYLVYAKRTPIGKLGGSLASVRPDDLLASLIKDALSELSFPPEEISDFIAGCANQAGEDNRNIARMAAVLGGLPYSVPGMTINRLCASSLDALLDAFARIRAGLGECYLVGGVESMTRAPYVLSKSPAPYGRDAKLYDTTFGWRFPNPEMEKLFPLLGMGETAEEVAECLKISREEQDKFALNSHQKAVKAQEENLFKEEILPISIRQKKQTFEVDQDEGPRKETSLEKLSSLSPVFKKRGSVTAGNSSMMNDGAALLCLASEDFVKKYQLTPLLEVLDGAISGIHPSIMGLGPVESTKKLLSRMKINIDQFDVAELNEAFAVQVLGCLKELKFPVEKVNLRGGAISLGHPLGASGARIVCTLSHIMKKRDDLKLGLASMCVGVGQGVSIAFRRP